MDYNYIPQFKEPNNNQTNNMGLLIKNVSFHTLGALLNTFSLTVDVKWR